MITIVKTGSLEITPGSSVSKEVLYRPPRRLSRGFRGGLPRDAKKPLLRFTATTSGDIVGTGR